MTRPSLGSVQRDPTLHHRAKEVLEPSATRKLSALTFLVDMSWIGQLGRKLHANLAFPWRPPLLTGNMISGRATT